MPLPHSNTDITGIIRVGICLFSCSCKQILFASCCLTAQACSLDNDRLQTATRVGTNKAPGVWG